MNAPAGAPSPRPQHFSMIRNFHLADLFTISNGFCGVAAIFASLRFVAGAPERELWVAAALIPVAIVFDFLDGHIARWRHKASAMGRELDSLADVISFGAAPASIAWAAGLRGYLDEAILMLFVGCGLSRLARYNVSAAQAVTGASDKVPYYEGTPITFSILPLAILLAVRTFASMPMLSLGGLGLHPIALIFLVSGGLMISKTLRIPKP